MNAHLDASIRKTEPVLGVGFTLLSSVFIALVCCARNTPHGFWWEQFTVSCLLAAQTALIELLKSHRVTEFAVNMCCGLRQKHTSGILNSRYTVSHILNIK